jgi:hypothetical protein
MKNVNSLKQAVEYAKSQAGKRATTYRTVETRCGRYMLAPWVTVALRGQEVVRLSQYSGATGSYEVERRDGQWVWTGWRDMPEGDKQQWLAQVREVCGE